MTSKTKAVDPNYHFKSLMEDMRFHYKSGSRTSFPLMASPHAHALMAQASPRRAFAADDGGGNIPDILSDVAAQAKAGQEAGNATSKQGATDATSQVQKDSDANSFRQKMQQQRDQAKQTADATIDKAYDKAIDLGTQNPAAQNIIAQGMGFISDTLGKVIGGVMDFVTSLIGKVVDIISKLLAAPLQFIEQGFSVIEGLFAF
jgi:hypothetical protein